MAPQLLSLVLVALGAQVAPGRAAVVASTLATALAPPSTVQEDEESRFDALLTALDPSVPDDDAVERLATLGADLARLVIAWHRTEEASATPFDDAAWLRIERAAERIDRSSQQSVITTELAGDDPPRVAAAALHLLRRIGSADQADQLVELLHELAIPRPGRGDASDLALSTLREIQRRDKRLSGALGTRIENLPANWIGLVARDLARVGLDADDLDFVWRGLERRIGETALLSALAIVADDFVYRVDDGQLAVLRRRMLSAETDIAEQAVMAAARLGDDTIVEQLIAFLTQSEPRIRVAAAYGLKTLTGLPFGQEVELWERWYERSTAWWEKHGDTLADELRWSDGETAIELILEIARQRMRRAELVDALVGTFERSDDEVVDLAVLCLRELRWHGTPRRLVDLLETSKSARVQGIAWRALRTLTGLDAGPEGADWRLALLL